MRSVFSQIHEVPAKNEKRYSDNQQRDPDSVQQRMKLRVKNCASCKHKTRREGETRSDETSERSNRLPRGTAAFQFFTHD